MHYLRQHHAPVRVLTHTKELDDAASTKWGKRRYMQMESPLNPAKQEAAA